MPIFENLEDRVFQEISGDLGRRILRRGEFLFRQGDPSDAVSFVIQGGLRAKIAHEDGTESIVGEIGQGDPVGEMQIFSGGKRLASVFAVRRTKLVQFPKATFERLLSGHPEATRRLVEIIRRRIRRNQLILVFSRLFGPVDLRMVRDIEHEAEWIHLPRGEFLFRQGEAGESLSIVVSGRLRVFREGEKGDSCVIGEIGPGEYVGEMAVIAEEKRLASVFSVRDSLLVHISKRSFDALVAKYPQILMSVARTVVRRYRRTISRPSENPAGINIAVVPASADVPLADFSTRLTAALSRFGSTLYLNSERLDGLLGIPGVSRTAEDSPYDLRLMAGLEHLEANRRFVVLETETHDSPWTRRCLKQADRILIVGRAQDSPRRGEVGTSLLDSKNPASAAGQTLVLIHPDGRRLPNNTRSWLAVHPVQGHDHLRWDDEESFLRLARCLAGRAVGLVLSGGGARSMAHIGVVRALRESGIPIDLVGGASCGAVVAALTAMELDWREILEICKKTFIKMKPFSDYTLPLFSLIRGRKFEAMSKASFGDLRVEDLWTNFFCVSTDMTTADLFIHREGPVWKCVRSSGSFPGILSPVVEGRSFLIDGGVLNNLPGDIMRSLCGGVVIAVDVSAKKDFHPNLERIPSPWKVLWSRFAPLSEPIEVPTILDILIRTTMLNSIHKAEEAIREADFYLRPPVDHFGLLEFSALEKIVDIAYRYAKEKIPEFDFASILEKR
jgi:NTE family protein/lysophospholipid hydrolase